MQPKSPPPASLKSLNNPIHRQTVRSFNNIVQQDINLSNYILVLPKNNEQSLNEDDDDSFYSCVGDHT